MKGAASLGLLASALAAADESLHTLQQQPMMGRCPLNSIEYDGACVPATLGMTTMDNIRQNTSITLDEAREQAQALGSFPWSFLPECYTEEKFTEPICVFADQKFANGRGIYIVGQTSDAYKMLEKAAFADSDAHARMNNYANPPYEEREIPGKGRGLIANKTLHRGDQIFASTVLSLVDPKSYDLVEEEKLRLFHRGLNSLPPASSELYMSQVGHFSGDPIVDRIDTNAFDVSIDGNSFYANLPEIARINHDCRPNAAYFFDEDTLSQVVHATQTIYPGEEISITYINNERKQSKRTANLKENWGFDCSCSSCAAHPVMIAESDARIKSMDAITVALNDWSANSTATPEMAETLISLYEQERLFAGMGSVYKLASETYSSFGDRWNAIKYARLSIEMLRLDRGYLDEDITAMMVMANTPQSSWSWKKRAGHPRLATGCGHVH